MSVISIAVIRDVITGNLFYRAFSSTVDGRPVNNFLADVYDKIGVQPLPSVMCNLGTLIGIHTFVPVVPRVQRGDCVWFAVRADGTVNNAVSAFDNDGAAYDAIANMDDHSVRSAIHTYIQPL
jgi:hypothetical protein